MFVFPYECKDFSEWLEKTIEKTSSWKENIAAAVIDEANNGGDVIGYAVTLQRAESMLDVLQDVKQAYSEYQKLQRT